MSAGTNGGISYLRPIVMSDDQEMKRLEEKVSNRLDVYVSAVKRIQLGMRSGFSPFSGQTLGHSHKDESRIHSFHSFSPLYH